MGNSQHIESSPERYRRLRGEDNSNLLKFHEKERVELEEKIKNLQDFMLKINSQEVRRRLLDLQSQLSVLNHKLNHVNTSED